MNKTYTDSTTARYKETYTLSSQAELSAKNGFFKRDYYNLTGWIDSNGTTRALGSTIIPEASVSISAQWKPIEYSITYQLDGGTNGNNPTSYNIESETSALQDATKFQHAFDKWTENGNQILSIEQGSHGDKTLSASYIRTKVTGRYYANMYLKMTTTAGNSYRFAYNSLPNRHHLQYSQISVIGSYKVIVQPPFNSNSELSSMDNLASVEDGGGILYVDSRSFAIFAHAAAANLTSVCLPSVVEFSDYAFVGQYSLEILSMPSITCVPTMVDTDCFPHGTAISCYVPSSLCADFYTADNWSSLIADGSLIMIGV